MSYKNFFYIQGIKNKYLQFYELPQLIINIYFLLQEICHIFNQQKFTKQQKLMKVQDNNCQEELSQSSSEILWHHYQSNNFWRYRDCPHRPEIISREKIIFNTFHYTTIYYTPNKERNMYIIWNSENQKAKS